jgi:hypothetical protein
VEAGGWRSSDLGYTFDVDHLPADLGEVGETHGSRIVSPSLRPNSHWVVAQEVGVS